MHAQFSGNGSACLLGLLGCLAGQCPRVAVTVRSDALAVWRAAGCAFHGVAPGRRHHVTPPHRDHPIQRPLPNTPPPLLPTAGLTATLQVTHTVSFTLPNVADTAQLFAVRGVFRFSTAGANVNTPCPDGINDEPDDLIFQVLPNVFGGV